MTDGPAQTAEKASEAAVERNEDAVVDRGCNQSPLVEPTDDGSTCEAFRSDESQRTRDGFRIMDLRPRDIQSRAIEFLKAIEGKWMGLTSKLINRDGLDPDTVVTQDGETGVHACIRFQGEKEDPYYEPVLRCLLRHGANPNLRTDTGNTPAHIAACYNLTSVLELLDEFGGEVDVEDVEGYAPVHICAAWGKTEALEWLLTKGGVDVERDHMNGMSLAMFAASAGHLSTLECLKRLGANLRKPCRIEHELIKAQRVLASIMAMALYNGKEDVADWLAAECDIGKHESDIIVCFDPELEEQIWRRDQEMQNQLQESCLRVDLEGDDEEDDEDEATASGEAFADDPGANGRAADLAEDFGIPEAKHDSPDPHGSAPAEPDAYIESHRLDAIRLGLFDESSLTRIDEPPVSRVNYVVREDDVDSLDDVIDDDVDVDEVAESSASEQTRDEGTDLCADSGADAPLATQPPTSKDSTEPHTKPDTETTTE